MVPWSGWEKVVLLGTLPDTFRGIIVAFLFGMVRDRSACSITVTVTASTELRSVE